MSTVQIATEGSFISAYNISQFADIFIVDRLVDNYSSSQLCQVVVKRLRVTPPSQPTLGVNLTSLLSCWSTLTHPNVETFLGTMSIPGLTNLVSIVTPFHANGNIKEYVQENPTVNKMDLVREALSGLISLHSHLIIHGNIYSGNILIDAEGHPVITDAGLNTLIRTSADHLKIPQQYRWISYEVLILSSPPTAASDIYSFGRTIEEIFTLSVPFSHVRRLATFLFKMANRQLDSAASRHVNIPLSLWTILQECFALPQHRPTAEELLSKLECFEVRVNTNPVQFVLL